MATNVAAAATTGMSPLSARIRHTITPIHCSTASTSTDTPFVYPQPYPSGRSGEAKGAPLWTGPRNAFAVENITRTDRSLLRPERPSRRQPHQVGVQVDPQLAAAGRAELVLV